MPDVQLIQPDWPAPAGVKAISSTRVGGLSDGPYAGLNLGSHVGDDRVAVVRNRQRLAEAAAMPQAPLWLEQVHGVQVVALPAAGPELITADAAYSNRPGQVCAVMTADCLPVLFCDAR
ncbi:MAG: laccase domain-containing protein, partial [Alkalimonas sp.]|nr:laccase domain-containing protein [Alkalimonas sp.]